MSDWTPVGMAWSVMFSLVGFIMFAHGKREAELLHLICGVLLMGYSYAVSDTYWIVALGVVFLVAPFVPSHVLPWLFSGREPPEP